MYNMCLLLNRISDKEDRKCNEKDAKERGDKKARTDSPPNQKNSSSFRLGVNSPHQRPPADGGGDRWPNHNRYVLLVLMLSTAIKRSILLAVEYSNKYVGMSTHRLFCVIIQLI